MAKTSNVDVIRRGYEAFDKGDLEAIQNLFAEDAILHVGGRNQISGDYKGRDEVLGFLGQCVSLSDGTFKATPHDILGSEGHVVVLSRVTAERAGKRLDLPAVETYHLQGEKVSEAWFISSDDHVEDEFWA
jgi:uncharacterized protein